MERSGLEFIIKSQDAVRNLRTYEKALDSANKAADKAAKGKDLFGGTAPSAQRFLDRLKGGKSDIAAAAQQAEGLLGKISGLSDELPTATSRLNLFSQQGNFLGRALASINQLTGNMIPGLGSLSHGLSGMTSAANLATGGMTALGGAGEGAAAGLGTATVASGGTLIAVAALTAALAAGAAAFIAFGKRGASVALTAQAFGNLVSGANSATQVLQNLRQQTRGTVSDFDLMRLATLAFQGTSQEFKDAVAGDFGVVLDVTQRVAQATGRSADEIREKFVRGLRTGRAALLDDVGVVIDAEKAYREYAKSVGIAAGALTEDQKQAAKATEAIRQLKDIGLELGEVNPVLENLQKPFVAIRNALDRFGLAIQPLFEQFSAAFGGMASIIQFAADIIIPIISEIAKTMSVVFGEALNTLGLNLASIQGGLSQFAEVGAYVVATIQIIGEAVRGLVQFIGEGLRAAFGAIRGIIQSIFGDIGGDLDLNIESLAYRMAAGGGFIIGSFATGMLKGAKYVLQAVNIIAQIVADFLEGFSPPKRGPLSNIDKGGENVAKAWAEGFIKGFLPPVEQAAAFVETRLGAIGKLTAQQVKDRFAQLDSALQPFIDQLDIVKADLQAVAGFVDPALQAIDRQRKELIKAVTEGRGDVQALRLLDQRAEMLKSLGKLEQQAVDRAQLQLSLAQSQQAVERALLTIQQRRAPVEEAMKEIATSGGAAEKAVKSAAGGMEKAAKGAGQALEEGLGGGIPKGEAPDLISSEAINKAKAVLKSGFAAGLDASGFQEALGDVTGQMGMLQGNLQRIREADPVSKLGDKFSKLGDILTDPLASLTQAASDAFDGLIDSATKAGTELQNTITTGINNAQLAITTALPLMQTLFTSTFSAISGFITGLFDLDVGAIATSFAALFGPAGLMVTSLLNAFGLEDSTLTQLFGENGSIVTTLTTLQDTLKGILDSIKNKFSEVFLSPASPIQKIRGIFSSIVTSITDTLTNLVTTGISTALGGLFAALSAAFITPFVGAVNAIIGIVEGAINSVISAVNSALLGITHINEISIGRVNLADFLPRGALGTVGYRGPMLVGERGPELVNFGRPANVFPANLTRDILGALNGTVNAITRPDASTTSIDQSQNSFAPQINVGNIDDGLVAMREGYAFMFGG